MSSPWRRSAPLRYPLLVPNERVKPRSESTIRNTCLTGGNPFGFGVVDVPVLVGGGEVPGEAVLWTGDGDAAEAVLVGTVAPPPIVSVTVWFCTAGVLEAG